MGDVAKIFPYRDDDDRLMGRAKLAGADGGVSMFHPYRNAAGQLMFRGANAGGQIVKGFPYRSSTGQLHARIRNADTACSPYLVPYYYGLPAEPIFYGYGGIPGYAPLLPEKLYYNGIGFQDAGAHSFSVFNGPHTLTAGPDFWYYEAASWRGSPAADYHIRVYHDVYLAIDPYTWGNMIRFQGPDFDFIDKFPTHFQWFQYYQAYHTWPSSRIVDGIGQVVGHPKIVGPLPNPCDPIDVAWWKIKPDLAGTYNVVIENGTGIYADSNGTFRINLLDNMHTFHGVWGESDVYYISLIPKWCWSLDDPLLGWCFWEMFLYGICDGRHLTYTAQGGEMPGVLPTAVNFTLKPPTYPECEVGAPDVSVVAA